MKQRAVGNKPTGAGARRHKVPPKDQRVRDRVMRQGHAAPPPTSRGHLICGEFRRFPTKKFAKQAASEFGRTYKAFYCEHCRGWHLAHKRAVRVVDPTHPQESN